LAYILVGLLLLCFARFTWAVRRHFDPGDGMQAGARVITGLSLGFAALLATAIALAAAPSALGVALYLGSLGLFEWAIRHTRDAGLGFAFTEALPGQLVTSGPYGLVRHPLYTAYILFWLAGAVSVAQPWAVLPALVMTALYWRAASREEAQFAATTLSGLHGRYRETVGMFFPRVAAMRRASAVRS